MITFFPIPYPDELLYSTIARYHVLSGNTLYCQTAEDLFGLRRAHSSVLMPLRLGYLGKMTTPFGLSVDKLINQTLYPYYTAFQSEELCQDVYNLQSQNKSISISPKLGAVHYIPQRLCFCPKCYSEDQQQHGEGYWHRMHQTPGVLVCKKHRCQLLQTQIPYHDFDSNIYEVASPAKLFPAIHPVPLSSLGQQQAANIASDIYYIYNNYNQIRKAFAKHQFSFANLFISLLQKKGLATKGGTLRLAEFKKQFYDFFAPDLIEQLGISFDASVKKPWFVTMCRHSKKGSHPLHYVLLSRFLCHGLPHLIHLAEESIPENLAIQKVDYGIVSNYEEKRENYRAQWLDIYNAMPGAGRSELCKAASSTYTWLLRHDKNWLMEHPKGQCARGGNKVFADRPQQDLLLSAKVPAAAQELRDMRGKPIWITKSRLAKQLGLTPRLLSELPKTQKAFEKEVEDHMDYRLRKIAWAEKELLSQRKPAARWQVLKLAGIRDCDWDKCWEAYCSMDNNSKEIQDGNIISDMAL